MQKQGWGFNEIFQYKKRIPETKFKKHCLKTFFTMDKANYVTKNELFLWNDMQGTKAPLTLWHRIFFLNFSTFCI